MNLWSTLLELDKINDAVPTLKESAESKHRVTIVYDSKAHKLRARADDGVHGEANVAFPNHLREKEGQVYQVDELIWNGKNYRASGTITPAASATPDMPISTSTSKSIADLTEKTKEWLIGMKEYGLPGDTFDDYDLGADDKIPAVLKDYDALECLTLEIKFKLKSEPDLYDIFINSTPEEELYSDDESNYLDLLDLIADALIIFLGL
jgi:hypothetical protein